MPITIDKCGPEGGAFSILRHVQEIMHEAGRVNEWERVQSEMLAVSYSELCVMAEQLTLGSIEFVDSRAEKWQHMK